MLDRITEKVPITIHPSAEIGSIAIANEIANLIRYRNQEGPLAASAQEHTFAPVTKLFLGVSPLQ